jgi:urease accessory protein
MKKYFLFIVLLASNQAFAHPNHDTSFYSALLHPLIGWDHLLTMLIIGVMAYQFPIKKGVILPAIFVSSFGLSAVFSRGLGIGDEQLHLLNQMILVTLIVLPLVHILLTKLSFSLVTLIIGVIGVFHGVTHGVELDVSSSSVLMGLILSTLTIHAIGFFVAMSASKKHDWILKAFTICSGVFAATLFVQSI